MKTLRVAKASKTLPEQEIDSIQILIDGEMPELETLEDMGEKYDYDAMAITHVLVTSLPGGTLIRLIARLLKHQAEKTFFKVPDTQ